MQGQYGAATDKKLRDVAKEMWRDWGFRKGVMRGYWVLVAHHIAAGIWLTSVQVTFAREIPAYAGYVMLLTLTWRSDIERVFQILHRY